MKLPSALSSADGFPSKPWMRHWQRTKNGADSIAPDCKNYGNRRFLAPHHSATEECARESQLNQVSARRGAMHSVFFTCSAKVDKTQRLRTYLSNRTLTCPGSSPFPSLISRAPLRPASCSHRTAR